MLRFLTDGDFDGRLTNALLARMPGLDLVRVQDTGLIQTPDPDILSWGAVNGRIVLTHDRNTMTGFAGTRVSTGQPMLGLFVVDQHSPLGRILNDLEALAAASEMNEWQDRIIFVPL
jgi:predicted nuclease of predicted toxin-antitoxin system